MVDPETEAFNERMSIKWMKLPKAHVDDLVAELSKRDEVTFVNLKDGESFTFHGKGKLIFVEC